MTSTRICNSILLYQPYHTLIEHTTSSIAFFPQPSFGYGILSILEYRVDLLMPNQTLELKTPRSAMNKVYTTDHGKVYLKDL